MAVRRYRPINYPVSGNEVNDLTASVTWANVPDANITQSSVTQHQAALTITESQISDLQAYLTSISEANVETALASATAFTANNYVFNVDQVVGAGTDNYVLTYDNATGEIGLEAAAGGGIGGTIAANQVAYGSGTDTIAGSANLTWDGSILLSEGQIHGTLDGALSNDTTGSLVARGNNPYIVIVDENGTANSRAAYIQQNGTSLQFGILGTSGTSSSFLSVSRSGTTVTAISFTPPSSGRVELNGGGDMWLRDACNLRVYDSGDTDYMDMQHDGTDFNMACTNTTDVNITGAGLNSRAAFRNVTTTGNTATTDLGTIIRFTAGGGSTFTLDADPPANAWVLLDNSSGGSWTIAASVSLIWAKDATTGNRTLADDGMALAIHRGSGTWIINGSALLT